MALVYAIDKVTQAISNNHTAVGEFLDLSKAFDTIDRIILVTTYDGIRGTFLSWFILSWIDLS